VHSASKFSSFHNGNVSSVEEKDQKRSLASSKQTLKYGSKKVKGKVFTPF